MAWDAVVTEALAENGFTSWFELLTKEIAHIQVSRTDAGTTDSMIIEVFTSVDNGTTIDTLSLIGFTVGPNATPPVFSFSVTGVRYFRVRMTALGSTDTITCNVNVTRDGGIGI